MKLSGSSCHSFLVLLFPDPLPLPVDLPFRVVHGVTLFLQFAMLLVGMMRHLGGDLHLTRPVAHLLHLVPHRRFDLRVRVVSAWVEHHVAFQHDWAHVHHDCPVRFDGYCLTALPPHRLFEFVNEKRVFSKFLFGGLRDAGSNRWPSFLHASGQFSLAYCPRWSELWSRLCAHEKADIEVLGAMSGTYHMICVGDDGWAFVSRASARSVRTLNRSYFAPATSLC